MKNILFLDHFNRHGGAQEYVIDIARELSNNPNFRAYVSKVVNANLRQQASSLSQTSFRLLSDSFSNPFFWLNGLINVFQIRSFVKKENIQVIHCNSIPALALAKIAGTRISIIFTCHDYLLGSIKLWIIKKCPDRIIAVSQFVKDFLVLKGVTAPVMVIPNGFQDIADATLPSLKPNPAVVTFGLICRFEKWKGCELFIDAAKEIKKRTKQAHFVLVGQGENEAYSSQLKKLALDAGVEIIEFTLNKKEIYSKIDVVVNCSVEPEPFGRTLVEAAIFGLPAIGPNEGGPAEIISHGITGFHFYSRSKSSLIDSIILLLQEPSQRTTFGVHARKKFDTAYRIEFVAQSLGIIYNS